MFKAITRDQKTSLAILVAALGYFVDVYDLLLFSIVRVESLKSLGLSGDELLNQGVYLLNMQMVGMLCGGVLWGVWGDKRGRVQVLFGSILLYSVANVLNGFVTSLEQYAILRFIAGVGLAGELGAGITLVSELMPKETRGIGTTIVASVGVTGAVVAGLVGDFFEWRTAYIIGGVMGLALLLLRVSVSESGLFDAVKSHQKVARGDLKLLFNSRERITRYLNCILVGGPIWFVVGLLVTFSPEIGVALEISEPIKTSSAVLYCYVGVTIGDLASGLLSQLLQSRRKTILAFILAMTSLSIVLLNIHGQSAQMFYTLLICIGFFVGYWAVFVTSAAEQFGTNLRATVATTAPNFVRGMTIPITLLFTELRGTFGVLLSAQIVCGIVTLIALYSLWHLKETFGRDLNFLES